MTGDSDDDVLARLRYELGAVDVHSHPAHVDSLLAGLHQRRGEQRKQRRTVAFVVAAALTVVATTFSLWPSTGDGHVPVAVASIADWGVRGQLAGDDALIERARQAWSVGGSVRAVYAGSSPPSVAPLAVVVLVAIDASGATTVGFVTSPVGGVGESPDTSTLVLRATGPVQRGQRAVGFVSATPLAGDEPITGGGSIGFALAEPGVEWITLDNSATDSQVPTPRVEPGVTWNVFADGAGAWDTVATFDNQDVVLASGVDDPVVTEVVPSRSALRLIVPGTAGDYVATPDGVIGVITADGSVDTDLTGREVEIRHMGGVTGTLGKQGSVLTFEPASSRKPFPGNRVSLADAPFPLTVGFIDSTDPWTIRQAASSTQPGPLLRISAGTP
ncbi:hypothetical protein [Actinokineospora pegani]|uniref:hypothetical protein n=1 Tax=Actinokineospora pegani TaxID=2654637 RepID=UPI0012EA517E|nr:hypothetical protein [Actinokineospora pegani]